MEVNKKKNIWNHHPALIESHVHNSSGDISDIPPRMQSSRPKGWEAKTCTKKTGGDCYLQGFHVLLKKGE